VILAASAIVTTHNGTGVTCRSSTASSDHAEQGRHRTGREPERIKGTITIRGKPLEVDDTLLFLEKALG